MSHSQELMTMTGTKIRLYELTTLIGAGAFGAIYKGVTGQDSIAIKIFLNEKASKIEADLLRTLHNSGVVPKFYFDTQNGIYHIIVIINALESHGVEPSYVRVLENIYHDAESNIKILDDLTPVTIKRGVRQGCVLSPLLFNAVLEQVFNSLQWDEKHEYSIGINGDRLTNLRYADDIALIAHDRDTMQKMVDELIQESKKVGLVINKKKNVAMTNLPTTSPDNLNIKINGQNINIVDKFIYLGSSVSFDSNNNEIQRRISSAWGAFTKHRQFLTDRRAVPRLKKGVFMTCVVPCFLYGCEAGALRIEEKRKIDVARRRMERAMLGISRLDRIRNVEIAKRTFAECNRTVVEKKSKLGMEGCQRGRKKMVT
ncbi:hypothetical protein B9Z55_028821 [Caenorhabditis nigoni]|uniref:Reverse transcriptase domain-containing protein n=1 Tax=Caenorhabditis nigoni TaxID=1611254 RepID=A0A2G5S9T8_9PELO|nr:hypothetical protein B9Z55_028821 [Caenorhabditis nigoni]